MGAIKRWLTGKNLATAMIVPCTVNSAGVITEGTGKSLLGRCEGLSIRHRTVTDQIMSVDDIIANNVVLYDDYTITIKEILTQKTGSTYEPALPSLYYTADLFKITIAKGGKQYVIYGIRSEMDDSHEGHGKQTSSMTLVAVNVNADNSGLFSITYGDSA